jgi:hypothetical protein
MVKGFPYAGTAAKGVQEGLPEEDLSFLSEDDRNLLDLVGMPDSEPSEVPGVASATDDFNFMEYVHTYMNDLPFVPAFTDPTPPVPAVLAEEYTADGVPLFRPGDMAGMNEERWKDIAVAGTIGDKLGALANSEGFAADADFEFAMAKSLALQFIKENDISRGISAFAGRPDVEEGLVAPRKIGMRGVPPVAAYAELEPIHPDPLAPGPEPPADLFGMARERGLSEDKITLIRVALAHEMEAAARPVFGDPTRYESVLARNVSNLMMITLARYGLAAGFVTSAAGDVANFIQGTPPAPLGEPQDLSYRLDKSVHVDYPVAKAMGYNWKKGANVIGLLDRANLIALRHDVSPASVLEQILNPDTNQEGFRAFLGLQLHPPGGTGVAPHVSVQGAHTPDPSFIPLDPEWALSARMTTPRKAVDAISRDVRKQTEEQIRGLVARGAFGEEFSNEKWQDAIATLFAISQANTILKNFGGRSLTEEYVKNLGHGLTVGTAHAMSESLGFLSSDKEKREASLKKMQEDLVFWAFDVGMVLYVGGKIGKGTYVKGARFVADPVGVKSLFDDMGLDLRTPEQKGMSSRRAAKAQAEESARLDAALRSEAVEVTAVLVQEFVDRPPGIRRVTGIHEPSPAYPGAPPDLTLSEIVVEQARSGRTPSVVVGSGVREASARSVRDWEQLGDLRNKNRERAHSRAVDDGRIVTTPDGMPIPSAEVPPIDVIPTPAVRRSVVSRELAESIRDPEMKGLLEEHARLLDEREAAIVHHEARLDILNPERADLASQSARANAAGMRASDVNRILAIQKKIGRSLDDIPTAELKAIAEQRGIDTASMRSRADLIEALELYRLMPLENWRARWLSTEIQRLGGKRAGNKEELVSRLRQIHETRNGLRESDLAKIESGARKIADLPEISSVGLDDVVGSIRTRIKEVAADPRATRQVSAALDVLETTEGIGVSSTAVPLPSGIVSFSQLSASQRARILSVYRNARSPSQRGTALAERGVMDPAIYVELGLDMGEVAVNTLRAREVNAARLSAAAGQTPLVMSPTQRLLAHEEKMAFHENMTLDQWRINRSLEERASALSKAGIDSIPMYEELGVPYNMAAKYAERASEVQHVVVAPKSPERVSDAFGPLELSDAVLRTLGRTPDVVGTKMEVAAGIFRRVLVGKEGAEIVAGRKPPAPGLKPLKSVPARAAWMIAEMMERPFAIFNIPAALSDTFGTLIARQGAGKPVLTEGFISLIEALTTGSAKFGELYFMTEQFRRTQTFHGDIIAPLIRELSGKGKKEIRLSAEDARNVFAEVFKAEEAEAFANQLSSDGDIVFRIKEANRFADVALRMEGWGFRTKDGANVIRFGELFEKQALFEGRWVPIDTLNKLANSRRVSPERIWGGITDFRFKPLKSLADMPSGARTAFYIANRYARPINKVIFDQSMQMAMHPETALLSVKGSGDAMGVVGSRKFDIYHRDALKKSANYLSDYYDARQIYLTTIDMLKSMSEGKSMAEVQRGIEVIDKLMGKVMPAPVVDRAAKGWKNERRLAEKDMNIANEHVDSLNVALRKLESEVGEVIGGKTIGPKEMDALSGKIKEAVKNRDAALVDALEKTDVFRELDGTKEWKASELVEVYRKDKKLLEDLPDGEIPASIERFYRSRVWKDLPYAEKLRMGLFDYREAVINTVLGQGHNLAFQKYITWMREGGMLITKNEYNSLSQDLANEYVNPAMKDSPVYGSLGDDFMMHRSAKLQLLRLNDAFMAARSGFGKWTSAWKLGMVAAVDTVGRNMWTNVFTLGLLSDIPANMSHLNRAHAELVAFYRTGKESSLLREYRSLGGGKSSVSQAEFMDPEIWVNYQWNVSKEYQKVQNSGVLEKTGPEFRKAVESLLWSIPKKGEKSKHAEFIKQVNLSSMKNPIALEEVVGPPSLGSRAAGVGKAVREAVARKYSYVDDLQKYSYFLQLVDDHGFTPRAALRKADGVYMDYADMSPLLNTLRNPGTGIRTMESAGTARLGEKPGGLVMTGAFAVGTSIAAPFVAFASKAIKKQIDLATIHPKQAFVLSHMMDAYNLACAQAVDMDVEELMAQMRLSSSMPLPIVLTSENPRAVEPSDMARVGPGKVSLLGMGLMGMAPADLQQQSAMGEVPSTGGVISAVLSALSGRGDALYQVGETFGDQGNQFVRYDPESPWGTAANNILDDIGAKGAKLARTLFPREPQRFIFDIPSTMAREPIGGRAPKTPLGQVTSFFGSTVSVADQRWQVARQGSSLRAKMARMEDNIMAVMAKHDRGDLKDERMLQEASSLYVNFIIPWKYGVDGGPPLRDVQMQAQADMMNKTMDAYFPAFIGLMRDRGMPMDEKDIKALEDMMIQQGLSETEAMMTLGDRMYQPPTDAMPAKDVFDILNYENE